MSWYSPLFKWFNRDISTKADPSYQYSAQFYSPGQPIWSDRNYKSFNKEGYRKCGAVYACVNKIANAAASIKWKLYTDSAMERTIDDHPLLDLWKKPNNRMGTAELIEQIFGFWHLDGNSYLWANRPNPKEPPEELWPLHPHLINIVAGEFDIQSYIYGYGTPKVRELALEDIMHLKFASYDDRIYYGLSPIEVAMRTVDQLNAGNDWNTALMQNDGRPSALFTSKGFLTTEQRAQVNRELRKKYSGRSNAGRPMVLEADMGYQSMAIPPKELDWLNSRDAGEQEIAMILDVPVILLNGLKGSTYANLKEAKQSLFTENVLPKMYRMVDHLNVWLVPMYPDLKQSGAFLSYDKRDIEVLADLFAEVETKIRDNALNLYNNGGCSLRYLQEVQGIAPKKSTYLNVYRFGPTTLIREDDLEAYAIACLGKLKSPPPVALPQPNQPALPAPTPDTTTVTESPDDEPEGQQDDSKKPASPEKRYQPRLSVKILDLASTEEKDAYMAHLESLRGPWEDKIEKRVQDYFKDEQTAIANALEACSTEQQIEDAIDSVLSGQEDALKQLIYDIWHDVGKHFSEDTAKQLEDAEKAYNPHYEIKDTVSIFSAMIIQWLLNLSSTKVTQINDTTREQLRKALADGVDAGEGIPQIAKRIDALYLDDIIPNRSRVISQTEVVGAANFAAVESARNSGLVLNKVWLATGDARTRPSHVAADGQEVGIDEKFIVGGVGMDRPGDVDAPAKEVVSCRCTIYFKRVKKETATNHLMINSHRKTSPYRAFMEAYSSC